MICDIPSLLYVVLGSGVEYPNDRDIQVLISASFHSCARGLRCLLDACVFYLYFSITRFVALEIQKDVICCGSFICMAESCVSGHVVFVTVCDLCRGGIFMCIYCFTLEFIKCIQTKAILISVEWLEQTRILVFFCIWQIRVDVRRKSSYVSPNLAAQSASYHSCPSGRNAAYCRATLPRVGWCNWKTNTYNAQLAAILCRRGTGAWPLNLI